jgi:hypothetical protein
MISPLLSKALDQRGLGMLSVVFLLIALSATVGVSLVMLQPEISGDAAARTSAQLATVSAAIVQYRNYAGAGPASLDALVTAPSGMSCAPDTNSGSATFRQLRGWCGPYLDQEIQDSYRRDGWGAVLQFDGTQLTSCGPNRSCGDGDDVSVTP